MPIERAGFTLIELLIVIAIVAVLSVVVILALNPAELLRQARDSTRLSDMDTLNRALALYQADNPSASFGVASTTYLSFPDPTNATSTCAGLGIPSSTAPSGWNNQCTASSTYRAVNGNGWVPVAFSTISSGSPLSQLPVDPANSTSTNYRYVAGANSWAVSAMLESQKMLSQQAAQDGGYDSGRYEKGSNLVLIAQSEGLVGWWTFSEGAGGTTIDSSGNGNNGTWNGTGTHYVSGGKASSYAAQFNGTDDYISLPANPSFYNAFASAWTITMWTNSVTIVGSAILFDKPHTSHVSPYYQIRVGTTLGGGGSNYGVEMLNNTGGYYLQSYNAPNSASVGVWTFVVSTFSPNNTTLTFYQNGVQVAQSVLPSGVYTNYSYGGALGRLLNAGAYWFNGKMDDVRIYNRALSAAEIAAIYNATK